MKGGTEEEADAGHGGQARCYYCNVAEPFSLGEGGGGVLVFKMKDGVPHQDNQACTGTIFGGGVVILHQSPKDMFNSGWRHIPVG